jgi:predicted RNA-binding Zn-ribbon protein involved in translation (DUF1610 family)
MRLQWLLGNFADPQYALPPSRQRALSKHAHDRHMPMGRLIAWSAITIVVPLLLVYKFALPPVLDLAGVTNSGTALTIGVAALGLLAWPLSAWSYGYLYVPAMRKAMRDHGFDVCVGCGYRLAELSEGSTQCPECGRRRETLPGSKTRSEGASGREHEP